MKPFFKSAVALPQIYKINFGNQYKYQMFLRLVFVFFILCRIFYFLFRILSLNNPMKTNLFQLKLAFVFLCISFQGFSSELLAQCAVTSFGTSDCSTFTMDISSFTFATVTSANSGCNDINDGHTYFSTPVRTVTQGQTYSFTIVTGSVLTSYGAIWIDYNNNGQFETTENAWNSGSTSNTTFTGNITIPMTASVATVRMRVRIEGETVMGSGSACTNYMSQLFPILPGMGESEDYDLTIQAASSTIDMSATALVTPVSPMCVSSSSNVVVQIRNLSSSSHNFATNPVTVSGSVTGPNPQTFTPVVINTGTLASNATQNVTLSTGYTMSTAGTYTFNANTSVTGDANTSNDAMSAANVTVNAAPTASLSGSSTICSGNTVQLSFNLSGGSPYSITFTDGISPQTITGIGSSPHLITVTPASSRTYTLTAASNSNCPASSAAGTHTVLVSPVATATMTGTATICPSANTNLTVLLTGMSPFSFTYTDGTVNTTVTGITANSHIITVNPPASRNYSIVSMSGGCGSGTVSGTAIITVSASSTAVLSGASTFCAGSGASLQVAFTGASPWTLSYTDGTGNFSQSGILTSPYQLLLSPVATTTYTLTGLSNACGSGTVSGSGILTQVAAPSALLSGGGNICSGNASQMSLSLSGTGPWTVTYTDGTNNTQINASTDPYFFQVSPTANTTYALSNVSEPGCSAGTVSGNAIVTIGGSALAVLSGSATTCAGQSANLSVSLSGGAPYALSYTNGSGTFTITGISGTPYTLSVTPGTNTTYTLVSMHSGGCGAGTVSGAAVVNIVSAPIVILSGNTAICSSGSGNLNLNLNGTPPWSVTYTDGTNPVTVTGISSSPWQIPVSPSANTVYSLTQVEDLNCPNGLFTGSATFTVGTPVTGQISGPASVCTGANAALSIQFSGNNQFPYTLTYTDGTVLKQVSGITSNPYYLNTTTLSSANTYTLLTVSHALCTGSLSPDTLVIGLIPSPTAMFTAGVIQDSVFTSNTSLNATGFSWDFGDSSALQTGVNPSHTYASNGSYTITLIAVGACGSDTSTQSVVIQVVSRDQFSSQADFQVYPNPSSGEFIMEIPQTLKDLPVQISVFDIQGNQVFGKTDINMDTGKYHISTGLSTGNYILQIRLGDRLFREKIQILE